MLIQALLFSQILSPFAMAQSASLRTMQEGDTSVGRRQIQTGLEENWRHPSVEVYRDAQGRQRVRWEAIPEGAGKVKLDQIRTNWAGQVFVVGGWVRDLLLGRTPNDMDLALALGSRYMTLDPAGLVEIRPEAYGDLLGESPWSESDAGQWAYQKARFQGLPMEIVHFAVDSEGIPSPEGMEFSFNRFVLGFDPADPTDPILFDPYQAWRDLFPSEGARRGRLVRAKGGALRSGPDLLDRIRRFAQDPDLRLGPLSSEDLALLQKISQAWRRLADPSTPVWIGNRFEELGDILDRFDHWLSQPSTGLEEWVGRVNWAVFREILEKRLIQSFSGIRGVVGVPIEVPVEKPLPDVELSPEFRLIFARYAYLYAHHQFLKFPDKREFLFVLGRDPRPSGKAVIEAQIKGMLAAAQEKGVSVRFLDAGVLATPFVEALIRKTNADGGVISTASHNELEWNGVKYPTAAQEGPGDLVEGGILLPVGQMSGIVQQFRRWAQGIGDRPEQAESFIRLLDQVNPAGRIESVSFEKQILPDVVWEARQMWGLMEDAEFQRFREKAQAIKIVVDSNGGASSEHYALFLEEFGFTVIRVNNTQGQPAHLIEPIRKEKGSPKTDALADAIKALKENQAHFAIVTDFDADRANTLFFDFATGRVEEPGPPEVAAMNVAMALSRRTLRRQAIPPDPRTMAIVAHNAFPMRIKEISRVFNADVSVVETGEVNVLEKMRQLEAQGLDVVIGVETANGGTVFRGDHGQILGDTSRNGAMVALFTGMVLLHPQIGRTWLAARNRYVSSSFKNVPAIEVQGPDPPSLVELLMSFPGERGKGSWHWVSLQEKPGRLNDVPEERIVPFKQVMEELWKKEFRSNSLYQIIHHVGTTEPRLFGTGDPPGAGLGTHGTGATTLESSLPDGRFFSIGLRGSQTEGMLRAFVEVQGDGAREIAEDRMRRFAQDWYPTALAAIRLPEAVERFKVERVRFGMSEKPIGFYLEGEGLRFARALALVSEQVWSIQQFHFAGVVPTGQERDALIASLAGHERSQKHLARYLVAVDQEGKGSLEAARNLARLYLTGREVQDVLSLEMDLLAQLDGLLRLFGYRLPDDPVIRDAALTLLRAA